MTVSSKKSSAFSKNKIKCWVGHSVRIRTIANLIYLQIKWITNMSESSEKDLRSVLTIKSQKLFFAH